MAKVRVKINRDEVAKLFKDEYIRDICKDKADEVCLIANDLAGEEYDATAEGEDSNDNAAYKVFELAKSKRGGFWVVSHSSTGYKKRNVLLKALGLVKGNK